MSNGVPPLPRGWKKNPAGQVTRVKREQRRMRVALRDVQRYVLDAFEQWPRKRVALNRRARIALVGNTLTPYYHDALKTGELYVCANDLYEYQVDLGELRRLVDEIARRLGELPDDDLVAAVVAAYEHGTADEVVNLAAITSEYTREVAQVIQSDPWQRRVALIRARVFEEMDGFAGDTGRDLGRVLSQSVEQGLNPMDVQDVIKQRFGVSMSRAERIARTEITQSYRRARWDEDADANRRLGIKTGLLWLSAFSPNSRKNHMALSGEVVTQAFVRDFYSRSGESVNCMCAQTSVLLNDDGSVATPSIVERVKRLDSETKGVPVAE